MLDAEISCKQRIILFFGVSLVLSWSNSESVEKTISYIVNEVALATVEIFGERLLSNTEYIQNNGWRYLKSLIKDGIFRMG